MDEGRAARIRPAVTLEHYGQHHPPSHHLPPAAAAAAAAAKLGAFSMEDFPYPDTDSELRLLTWEEQRMFKTMAMGIKDDSAQGRTQYTICLHMRWN